MTQIESPEPRPVIAYATPVPRNRAAALSLLFGLLMFVPVISGVLAIRFGRQGLRAARESDIGRERWARIGIALGVVNLVLSAVLLASLPSAVIRARRAALQVGCLSNLRSIGQATMIYASMNRGFLPPSLDVLPPVLGPGAKTVFICPECSGDPTKKPVTVGVVVTSNYIYCPPGLTLAGIRNASRTVLAYEPLTNHNGRFICVLFCDGHCEVLPPDKAKAAIIDLSTGQNPPPSLK